MLCHDRREGWKWDNPLRCRFLTTRLNANLQIASPLIHLPGLKHVRFGIIAKQPLLELRICPAIGISYKRLYCCQLPVSFSLTFTVRQIEYASHGGAVVCDTASPRVPGLLKDLHEVW